MSAAPGWDHPATVAAWRRFDRESDRYRRVNAALADHAALGSARRVLDVGAGTGGTAAACLARLPDDAQVIAVEPAAAMRSAGLRHPRLTWASTWPAETFDRVVCGAAAWLLGPLPEALARLAAHVTDGGALVFAIPAAYLGEEDPPGGGPDPTLTDLPRRLVADRALAPAPSPAMPDAAGVDAFLTDLDLRAEPWSVQTRWTLEAQAAWLRLPPVGGAMRPDLAVKDLDAAIDAALAACAPGSRRPERWRGWTAWR